MRHGQWSVLVGAAGMLVIAGCSASDRSAAKSTAQEMVAQATPTPMAGTVQENTVSTTATVEKIDYKTRKVTLRGTDGKSTTITAGDQVRNLAQVKKGDVVAITYYESLAYEVVPAGQGAPGVSVVEDAARAKPGERPAGAAAQAVTVTSTIEAIDKDTPAVTLKGPDGKTVAIKVRDRSKLDHVKVGDLVSLTYTEAVAIGVEPAAKGTSSGSTK